MVSEPVKEIMRATDEAEMHIKSIQHRVSTTHNLLRSQLLSTRVGVEALGWIVYPRHPVNQTPQNLNRKNGTYASWNNLNLVSYGGRVFVFRARIEHKCLSVCCLLASLLIILATKFR